MKQFIAFLLLFCLVFLNVPKNFVHNCEHKIHHSDNHHHENEDGNLSFDVDEGHCFVCEFDLGLYNVSEDKAPTFALFFNYIFKDPSIGFIRTIEFNAFSHRGPPTT